MKNIHLIMNRLLKKARIVSLAMIETPTAQCSSIFRIAFMACFVFIASGCAMLTGWYPGISESKLHYKLDVVFLNPNQLP